MNWNAARDADLIDRLQRRAFGYFERFTNPANGLVADTSLPDWPCSIASVGFGLTAWPVAAERGWRDRSEALDHALAAVRLFDAQQQAADRAVSHRGFFYHFLDMRSGARAWTTEISFIDTAILLAGMHIAAAYFDGDDMAERELRERVGAIANRVEWSWIVDRDGLLRMGWKPESGFLKPRWRGYSEALLIFALGLGAATSPLPASTWPRWLKTLQTAPSSAGPHVHAAPLFIHLFPQVWLDLLGSLIPGQPFDWFENTRRAIAAQRDYAIANTGGFAGYGPDLWGLTACSGPQMRVSLNDGSRRWIAGYRARGAPDGPDDGTVAPWAPLACLPFAPDEALSATRHILTKWPAVLDGHGCFIDAFNLSVKGGWFAARCTGLDQGLLVAMIENHRSGLIWRLSRQSPALSGNLPARP